MITKDITIPSFGHAEVQGICKIKGHTKRVYVVMEPPEKVFAESVIATNTYTELKLGFVYETCPQDKLWF